MPFRQLLESARFARVGPNVTEQHFPRMKMGEVEVGLRLVHLARRIDTEEVFAALKNLHLQAARFPDLVTFARIAQRQKRHYPVAALMAVWVSPDPLWVKRVAYIEGSGSTTVLDVHPMRSWHEDWRFLTVCK